MTIKLVKDKNVLYKTSTVLLSTLLVILSIIEIIHPYILVLEPVIPTNVFPWVSAILGIAIGIGRYIKQDLSDGKLDGRVPTAKGIHEEE